MKPSKLLYPFFISLIIAGFTACDEVEDPITPDEAASVEILSIGASATFDLSARADWKLQLGSVFYTVDVDNSQLTGTIKKGKGYRVTPEGITIFFYPSSYGRTRSEQLIPPLIGDQTTKEKFMLCDPLRGYYTGTASETITGIEFHHYNALVTFEVEDLPADAVVYIEQADQQKIRPLRNAANDNAFKAIVLPYYKELMLVIETGGKIYSSPLLRYASTRSHISYGIGNSAIIRFTAKIDEEKGLVIENLSHKTMVKEWPVTQ